MDKWNTKYRVGKAELAYVPDPEAAKREAAAWVKITHESKACEGGSCGTCRD